MKIVFALGILGLGGHTRSAVAIGRALRASGHDVRVFGVDHGGRSVVERGGLPLIMAARAQGLAGIFGDCTADDFARFARDFSPDVIHCFDDRALLVVAGFLREKMTPTVLTICGGKAPRYRLPDMCPIVAFSEELRDGLHQRHSIPDAHLFINAARVELQREIGDAAKMHAYRERHFLGDAPLVLLISRIDNTKMNAILHMIRTFELLDRSSRARLLVVGKVDSAVALRQVTEAVDALHQRLGEAVVTMTEDGAERAAELLPLAAVAVGVGRTAFEAMYHSVPTLIVGEHGLSGLATPAAAPRMARHNFSGRDAADLAQNECSPQATAVVLQRLLENSEYARLVGMDGHVWVTEHLDSRQGARFYAELYRRPAAFFVPPTRSGIKRLHRAFLLREIYRAILPSTIKDHIVLLRKRYGAL